MSGLARIADWLENGDLPTSGKAFKIPVVGSLLAWGVTVPTDGATGYAPGCIFMHTDGSGASDVLYVNIGTAASCNFDVLTIS